MAEPKTLEGIPVDWSPGDVILDLYEVRPVTEGFGVHARERPYHEGGFGRVYKVWHRGWQRDMAVKVPRPEVFVTKEQKTAFVRECEIWVNLGLHPHVASCHYVRELGGILRIFSDYSDADTLEAWIRSRRLYEGGERVALARMLDVAIQFAWGLHYAHEQGVIHRDVKPLNALMGADGSLRVTDFGIARAREKAGVADTISAPCEGLGSLLVSSGAMTPPYCSPEQRAGGQLDRRTDVWSWAVSVLQMFCGEVTWLTGAAVAEALDNYPEEDRHGDGIPAMPTEVLGLLRDCFRRDPAERPRTLQECAERLRRVFQAETGHDHPRTEPPLIADTPESLNNRGVSLLDLGREEDAFAAWKKALEKHPGHFEATYNLQVRLWERGRVTDQAVVSALDEARKSRKEEGVAAYHLGLVHLARRDGESAKKVLDEAVRLGAGQIAQEALLRAEELLHQGNRCGRIFNGGDDVNALCLSSDGRWALTGRSIPEKYGGGYYINGWDVSSGRYVRTFNENINGGGEYSGWGEASVCLSSDDRWALTGSGNGDLRLWEFSSGRRVRVLKGHTDRAKSVCMSMDGRWALSGSEDHTLRLWDVSSGRCVRIFEGHTDGVESVCLSSNGCWALSGSEDHTLRLWDVSSGRCVQVLKGHTDGVESVCLSSDGRWALSGSKDHTLRLWEVSSGRCVRIFEGHTGGVWSICLSSDDRWTLSGSSDKTLRLWEVSSGRCLWTFEEPKGNPIFSICMSSDDRWVLMGRCGPLRLLELVLAPTQPLPACLCRTCSPEDMLAVQVQFNQLIVEARRALNAGQNAKVLEATRAARGLDGFALAPDALDVWQAAGVASIRVGFRGGRLLRIFEGHAAVHSVCLSMDCRWALSGGRDRNVRLWDIPSGRCMRTFEGHTNSVHSVCLSPDGRLALSGSGDKTLRLWDISSGRCMRTFEGHTNSVHSVCLSPDGRLALSGSWDNTLRLWDVSSGRCVQIIEGERGAVCPSLDGRWALSGGFPGTLRLWDISSGRCIRTFEGKSDGNSVCLSLDGRWALSGSEDHTLRLWDVSSGRCVRIFEGHTGGVLSVCLSSDGRWALSGSKDQTLRLWEVSSGRCVRIFEVHTEVILSACLSSDGRLVLLGSDDRTLRLWELDWEYEFPGWKDWDDGAEPYLRNLLVLRDGRWSAEDFDALLTRLSHCGYGWLRREGVERKLKEMTSAYKPQAGN